MPRYAIIGNSGSGKSTLAAAIAHHYRLPSLDLDTVAWVPGTVGVARDANEAACDVQAFCAKHSSWVVEGCYENLVRATFPWQPILVFLDVDAEVCERHCHMRPHEPHKYATPEAQQEKLEFLLRWVHDYYSREGPMSRKEHAQLFDAYEGQKHRLDAAVAFDIDCSGFGKLAV